MTINYKPTEDEKRIKAFHDFLTRKLEEDEPPRRKATEDDIRHVVTDNKKNYLGGCLLFCALLVIQFSVVSVVTWIVCWCFGWEFRLAYALGINVLWIVLQVIAKGIKKV